MLLLILSCAGLGNGRVLPAQADLSEQEQQAFQQAVAAADPSIVRIETVGGVDVVDRVLTATGPTTGVIVHEEGYIITSRFNFVSRPSSVLVTLSDGQRFAAEIIGNDLSRMVTLLKIDATGLTPLPACPKSEIRVGQWALALGRTFDPGFPNVSVGIVSALHRVWGRALQTDAKTSPVNYGGPLIDISGRCLGILVPLSPQEQGETAGVEWYDSGIGFAVPLEDIQAVLDQLIAGETLKPGLVGFGFEDRGPLSGAAKILRVRPRSPAAEAGLKVNDIVEQIDGQPVARLYDLKHLLGTRYAGESLRLTCRREEETFEVTVTLAGELIAYRFPFLGILPARPVGGEDSSAADSGVRIRQVIAKSPAAGAGLQAGDVILRVGEEPVPDRQELARLIRQHDPEQEVTLTVRSDKAERVVTITLATLGNDLPEALPPEIPPAPPAPPAAAVGRLNEQLPNDGLSFWAYVPTNYRDDSQWGLLVWLHPPENRFEAETLRAWSEVCHERGLILLGPRSEDLRGWADENEQQVRDAVSWIEERYRIDPARICVMGMNESSDFAAKLAFKYRDRFRGLLMLNHPLRVPPPDNDPDFPLQFLFAVAPETPQTRPVEASVTLLRERQFPVHRVDWTSDTAGFSSQLVQELALWLDALDRI